MRLWNVGQALNVTNLRRHCHLKALDYCAPLNPTPKKPPSQFWDAGKLTPIFRYISQQSNTYTCLNVPPPPRAKYQTTLGRGRTHFDSAVQGKYSCWERPISLSTLLHPVAYLGYSRYGSCPGRHLMGGAPLSSLTCIFELIAW